MYPNPTGGYLETYTHPRKRQRTYHEELLHDISRIAKRPLPKPVSTQVYKKTKYSTRKKMPIKSRYRRKYRRGRRGIIRRRVPRPFAPRSKMITCKVVKGTTLTNTSGAISSIPVACNDISDPFFTSGTEQPLGYDQWSTIYNKAKVLGAKISVKFQNGANVPVIVGITRTEETDTNPPATITYESYGEMQGTRYRLLSDQVDHTTMLHNFSTKKHLMIKNVKDSEEIVVNLATSAAPTRSMLWRVWQQPHDKTQDAVSVNIVITVQYIVLLYDPQIPARSSG